MSTLHLISINYMSRPQRQIPIARVSQISGHVQIADSPRRVSSSVTKQEIIFEGYLTSLGTDFLRASGIDRQTQILVAAL